MATHSAVCATAPFRGRFLKHNGVARRTAVVVTAVSDTQSPPHGATLFGIASSVILLTHSSPSHAETLKTMTVGAGNAAFLEKEFVDLKYAGVKTVVPGTATVPGLSEPVECVQVSYDADKIQHESLMRTYWQHANPVNPNGSFAEKGDRFKGVVWVGDGVERKEVETNAERLISSGIFGRDKTGAGLQFTNLKILDAPAKEFTPFPDDMRLQLTANPKAFEKLSKPRQVYFKDMWGFVQFCAEKVCGYVRFAPRCQGECLAVFPQYTARNAGVPELDGNVKITGRS